MARTSFPTVVQDRLQHKAHRLRHSAAQLQQLLAGEQEHAGLVLQDDTPAAYVADLIAAHLTCDAKTKQQVLALPQIEARIDLVYRIVERQRQVHALRQQFTSQFQLDMSRTQRETLLRQQLRNIRRELGEAEEDENEIDQLRNRVDETDASEDVLTAARQQLKRMRMLPSASAEYQMTRNYVEMLVELPWRRSAAERLDIGLAREVLDADHFGVEHAKRRVLEHLAVRKLARSRRSPILCFVGPPGVGKTSIAKSIARATGRPFASVALGGIQDESEIRGHRRTYVGAMPGRIIAAIKRAGVRNAVMLLDEIDKLASHGRGDPASALLEVLDPEQHAEFTDHYLGLPFNLRHILFVATANRRDQIPRALLDRMEVIELTGYTAAEKQQIASRYVLPRQLQEHGLNHLPLDLDDSAMQLLVHAYCPEAGVRGITRSVGAICRWYALRIAEGGGFKPRLDGAQLSQILGPPRLKRPQAENQLHPGIATGLTWTPHGGDLMFVEATRMPGNGQIRLTGRMGDVLRESALAALSYVRTRASALGLPADFLSTLDIHVHLPQSARSRDGAGAGATILIALMSLLTRRRVRADLAITGEITLRGNVLPVTGVRDKCLAAQRAGLRSILLPRANAPEVEALPQAIRQGIDIRFVSRVEDVAAQSLEEDGKEIDLWSGSTQPQSKPCTV